MIKMSIEVVFVPVTDVDRAKDFYVNKIGLIADQDNRTGELRFVQLTPEGSACSIVFGEGITEMKPGTQQGIMMVVDDVRTLRQELQEKGVEISNIDEKPWGTFAYFKDLDGNGWTLQEMPHNK